ncbi:hypothetical protein PV325_002861 [Microctonus aethiopoides]|uniref:Lebercilin domain-containing protein n=1 Tax=Microctonus aethiopoides TaxID=144406 RepID=A0AA39KSC2_9HYME|nr:hypothetical protein PV325_002861 [Microctonus aethiopoides]KAK0172015.1 hypothetical protein PV328_005391 [Microctonus aethiopoides]
MQTEVPPLPIVYSEGDKHLTRKVQKKNIIGVSPTESKNHTAQCNHTTPFFVFNRKQLNPILGGPYRDSMRLHCQSEPARGNNATCKNFLGQRIISAKVLRVKELQNQLTDAHYHLNELANENRLLKALQKRQDSALKRYEGTNAELPRIINSHQEELKALQTKYKQLKFQHKQTCVLLKEKESEIYSLQNQNKHLLKLSKDQQLGEREKLQMQVSDLDHEIQQQHKTIQTLNRKLTLQSKKFKHQINTEVTKHRDTRKQLHITLEKLKTLEDLLNNREKRLYLNPHQGHQLPSFNRRKPTTSQSLTNLRNNSITSNVVKTTINQNTHSDVKNETLPKLNMKESNDTGKLSIIRTNNTLDNINASETMSSLDHIRKFRLPKSAKSRHSSPYASDENEMRDKLEIETDSGIDNCKINSITIKNIRDGEFNSHEVDDEEINDAMNSFSQKESGINKKYHMPEKFIKEFGFLSGNSELSDDDSHTDDEISPTSNSKYLHARLINPTTNGASSTDEEPFHMTTNKKSRVSKTSAIDEAQSSHDVAGIRNKIILKNKNDAEDHDNISSSEFPRLDIEEISSYAKIKCQNISDMKKSLITSRQNSYDRFDTNNEESFKNDKDLWTRLRERLNTEQVKNPDSPQSVIDAKDTFATKNVLVGNLESERNNSVVSDELLHYFDMEKNTEEFNKLIISENHERYSQITITNGSIPKLDNESSSNVFDEIPKKNSLSSEKNDKSSKEENGVILEQNKEENISIVNQSDVNIPEVKSSKQPSANQEHLNEMKAANFNKQKLLAAMKAIDDNENIESIPEKKVRETNNSIRSQVTENLYRGLPTHARKRDEIIKDIFSDTKIENKLHSGCSKLH